MGNDIQPGAHSISSSRAVNIKFALLVKMSFNIFTEVQQGESFNFFNEGDRERLRTRLQTLTPQNPIRLALSTTLQMIIRPTIAILIERGNGVGEAVYFAHIPSTDVFDFLQQVYNDLHAMLKPRTGSWQHVVARMEEVPTDWECAICLNNADKDAAWHPNLCHGFHKECIEEWLGVNECCPLCRSKTYGPLNMKPKQPSE